MKRVVKKISVVLELSLSSFSKKFSLFGLVLLASVSSAFAQDGESTFKQNCAMCHSVGNGRVVGPDLKDVDKKRKLEWILQFVKGSQDFIKSGDADAKAIFDQFQIVMPNQNLSDEQIKSVVAYIASKSAESEMASKEPEPVKIEVTSDLVIKGMHYFEGSVSLSNGGPACISCHNVDYFAVIPGGVLAKDLTTVHSRLGGDDGVKGILGAPPFPAMTTAYKTHPISDEEIAAITGFLSLVDKDKQHQTPQSNLDLLQNGTIGLGIVLVLIFIIWNKKKREMVKQDIYDRQRSTF